MSRQIASPSIFVFVLLVATFGSSQCAKRQSPTASNPSHVRPSEIVGKIESQPAPTLAGAGEDARKSVLNFLAWAGASTVNQKEAARKAIAAAAENQDVVKALIAEISDAETRDNSRALLALSVLGEMRSRFAMGYLRDFIHKPLPKEGQLTNGEDPAQTNLALLQAKAVAGLAYMNERTADSEVFWAAGKHESRIVRAEAIRVYLLNHQGSEQARKTLLPYVRKGEEIFLERPNRDPGERAESFNRKLELYLKAHPEIYAPNPERGQEVAVPGRGYDSREQPPRF